jgi:hypothetical protein
MLLDVLQPVPAPDGSRRYAPTYYAYWFVGIGRETPYHLARMFWLGWDRVLHGVAHRWAYVAVVAPAGGEESEDIELLKQFVAQLHPRLVVPDGAPPR